MADAQTSIVNRALYILGQEPVTDLTDASLQQSLSATKLLRVLEDARDLTLARHGWACALTYASLTAATVPNYVNFRYPSVFLVPGDFVRVWEVADSIVNGFEMSGTAPRWQLGTTEVNGGPQTIIQAGLSTAFWGDGWCWADDVTAIGTLNLCYVRRADWAALAPHVREALAYQAAALSAGSILGAGAMMAQEKAAEEAAMRAISVDGTQEGNQPPWAPSIPMQIRRLSR